MAETKLKMLCIFILIILLVSVSLADPENIARDKKECEKIDLMIVVDGSGSVSPNDFKSVKIWIKQLADTFRIEDGNVQIGVVQYSHWRSGMSFEEQPYIVTEIELGEYRDITSFRAAVDKIEHLGYTTFTAHAINKTVNYDFQSSRSRYPQAHRAMILITDGGATDARDLPGAVQHATDAGVVIFAVGVGQFNNSELLTMASDRSDRMFSLRNFDELGNIVDQMYRGVVCDCDPTGSLGDCDPCTGQCTCKPNAIGKRCESCVPGFLKLESACQECEKIDLMIVVDGSRSIVENDFKIVKMWIKKLAHTFRIEDGNVQIGVVQYSHWFSSLPLEDQSQMVTEIELGEYRKITSFRTAVDKIEHLGYTTYTAHAINKTVNYDFQSSRSRYPQAHRVMIVITDGVAVDARDLPGAVQQATDAGVVIFAVGVGQFSGSELLTMTSDRRDRVFSLRNFGELGNIVDQIYRGVVCDCDSTGSVGNCDPCTGQCTCKPNVVGKKCDACADGYYGMVEGRSCEPCNCLADQVCNKQTGACE